MLLLSSKMSCPRSKKLPEELMQVNGKLRNVAGPCPALRVLNGCCSCSSCSSHCSSLQLTVGWEIVSNSSPYPASATGPTSLRCPPALYFSWWPLIPIADTSKCPQRAKQGLWDIPLLDSPVSRLLSSPVLRNALSATAVGRCLNQ